MNSHWLFAHSNPYAIIRKPVFTEKSQLAVAHNQYTFFVHTSATKQQIARAIYLLYGVDVRKVRVTRYKSRVEKTMRGQKRISGAKKAIVEIAAGQLIDFEKLA